MGREFGQALWPEAKPIEFLEAQRLAMGDYEFQALFQGNPSPREGSFFKVGMIEFMDARPAGMREFRAWDVAATEGGGDYTAGVRMGVTADGHYVISDVVRGQWDTAERNRQMRLTAELDGVKVAQCVPEDPGSGGKDAAKAFVRLLAGFSVKTRRPSADKETRADPLSSQLNAGNVRVVRGDWNRAFVEELRQFPMGKHDDQVDAAADAFNELSGTRELMFY